MAMGRALRSLQRKQLVSLGNRRQTARCKNPGSKMPEQPAYDPFLLPELLPVPSAQSVVLVRQALNLSQEELAMQLAVDRRTVARWEAGESTPHPVYVNRMLAWLQAPKGII